MFFGGLFSSASTYPSMAFMSDVAFRFKMFSGASGAFSLWEVSSAPSEEIGFIPCKVSITTKGEGAFAIWTFSPILLGVSAIDETVDTSEGKVAVSSNECVIEVLTSTGESSVALWYELLTMLLGFFTSSRGLLASLSECANVIFLSLYSFFLFRRWLSIFSSATV